MGAEALGRQPPAHRRAPSASTAWTRPKYGYWGFSPASRPGGGYREYGVDAIGLNPDGYFSDMEKTNYDAGFGGLPRGHQPDADLRRRRRHPARVVPGDARTSRGRPSTTSSSIERELEAYGDGGFYDAVAVKSGTVARRYLSLDQAMVMGAIGNVSSATT